MTLLLNTNSVIMCPHGGVVTHVPVTFTSYRIEGRRPMLLSDIYTLAGCPLDGGGGGPCMHVGWVTASQKMMVRGVPVLTDQSIGLCQSAVGAVQGPAIIASCQLLVFEPDELTNIHY